jgi:hypothetical protein
MNLLVKSGVVAALALGASQAFAIGLPNTNSSDLILLVENTTTGASYALDTGISLNTILPTSSLVPNAVLNTSLAGINSVIAASSTLQSFLAANPASGDGWELIGGQFNGGGVNVSATSNSRLPGTAKAAYSTINPNQGGHVLSNLVNIENNLQNEISIGTLIPLINNLETTSTTALAPSAIQKYGVVANDTLGALGSSQSFFAFTGNTGTGTLQSYILGSATLATNGTLTFTGNSVTAPVPLPAAVWLLGSGLMGLVGVSRRRKATV